MMLSILCLGYIYHKRFLGFILSVFWVCHYSNSSPALSFIFHGGISAESFSSSEGAVGEGRFISGLQRLAANVHVRVLVWVIQRHSS